MLTLSRSANILDPIEEALDPDVFKDPDKAVPHLKPRIRKWITRNVYNLLKNQGWKSPEKNFHLVMTGSLTTYQWSEKSDFDVSLFVEWDKLPEIVRAELISLMVHTFDGVKVPGTTHVMQVYVVPQGITPEDLYKAGLRSAYDLDNDNWIVPPEKGRVADLYKELPALITYAKMQFDKMTLLLKYDMPGAKEFWDQIHKRRARDQKESKGDFAESNVIYKWIVNRLGDNPLAKTSGRKFSMPPFTQVQDFERQFADTPVGPPGHGDVKAARGYDWAVDPAQIAKLQSMNRWRLSRPVRFRMFNALRDSHPNENLNTFDFYDDMPMANHGVSQADPIAGYTHHIALNPLLTPEEANETIWHELQHAYQWEENRDDHEGYDPKSKDPAAYWEHPLERDANEFAKHMKQYPLVKRMDPYHDPVWQATVDQSDIDSENSHENRQRFFDNLAKEFRSYARRPY